MDEVSNKSIEKDESTASYNTEIQESVGNDCIMTDEEAKESENFLENVIMSWTKHKQHLYLKSINEPIYGTKTELTARIIGKMSIKDAVEFTREYKRKIRENDREIEGIESDK